MDRLLLLALVLGIGGGGALAWWLSRPSAEVEQAREQRAQEAAEANARDAIPSLYRWRDAQGRLQITEQPPKGRRYERVDVQPREGIEVDGSRQ